MVQNLQKTGSKEERTYRLIEKALEITAETGGFSGGPVSDEEMLAAALIERGIRFNQPEDIEKANELAMKDGVYSGSYFTPILFFKYNRVLNEKAKKNLLSDMRVSMATGNWLRVVEQRYGNVNIPQKGSQNNILGGEALGNIGMYGEAFKHGMKLLQDLLDIVNDCGNIPEYNSPTYVESDVAALSTIANYAKNKEAVLKARLLQEMIFLDLCSRYHEPTNTLAGPYSREYLAGRIAAGYQWKYVLYKELPQGLFIGFEPNYKFLTKEYMYVLGDARYMIWAALSEYSYPDYMNLLALKKPYPYEIQNTCKIGPDKWDQDTDNGGRFDMSSYSTEEYTLASASRECMHGQSHGVVLTWRKRPEIKSMKDFKTMIWAYISDEKKIGPSHKYAGIESQYHLLDEGRYRTVQNKNKIIALYQMKKLGTTHSSLKLNCYIPLYDSLDEIWIGDRKIETFPQCLNHSDTIYIKDHNTFVALRFLAPSDLGAERQVVIDVIEEEASHPRTLAIASYNYHGKERSFTPEELDATRNGFIVESATTEDYPSLESFREHIKAAKVEEVLYANGVWAVKYASGQESVSIVYHVTAHEVIERKVNGGDLAIQMFSSPMVKEDRNGHIEIGRTSLDTCFGLPVWLMADEKHGVYMVMNLNNHAMPVHLRTQDGELKTEALPLGRIIYQPKSERTLEILSATDLKPITFTSRTGHPKASINDIPVSGEDLRHQGGEVWTLISSENHT